MQATPYPKRSALPTTAKTKGKRAKATSAGNCPLPGRVHLQKLSPAGENANVHLTRRDGRLQVRAAARTRARSRPAHAPPAALHHAHTREGKRAGERPRALRLWVTAHVWRCGALLRPSASACGRMRLCLARRSTARRKRAAGGLRGSLFGAKEGGVWRQKQRLLASLFFCLFSLSFRRLSDVLKAHPLSLSLSLSLSTLLYRNVSAVNAAQCQ